MAHAVNTISIPASWASSCTLAAMGQREPYIFLPTSITCSVTLIEDFGFVSRLCDNRRQSDNVANFEVTSRADFDLRLLWLLVGAVLAIIGGVIGYFIGR